MPSKNRQKYFEAESYYHIYNRGVAKQPIFLEDVDYTYFLMLIKRYLSEGGKDSQRHGYKIHSYDIDLVAYCLMGNHFHFLIYTKENPRAMTEFMRSLSNSYVSYFNNKYERVGHLFQDTYKARQVDDDSYLLHITRYIHLNPSNFKDYPYSSYGYYVGNKKADWLQFDRIGGLFNGPRDYASFVESYRYSGLDNSIVESMLAGYDEGTA